MKGNVRTEETEMRNGLRLMVGGPGSGKSNGLKWDALLNLEQGKTSIVFDYVKNGELTEEFLDILPSQLYQLWDLTKSEDAMGVLCFPEFYQSWEEKTSVEKIEQLELLIDDLTVAFQVLKPKEVQHLNEVEMCYLRLMLKIVFSEKLRGLADVYLFLTDAENIREDYYHQAIELGVLNKKEIELYDNQDMDWKGVFAFLIQSLGEMFWEEKTRLMIEYPDKGSIATFNDQPQLWLIKYPQSTFNFKERVLMTTFLNVRFMSILRQHRVSKGCKLFYDEVNTLGFDLRYQWAQLIKVASSCGAEVVMCDHNLEILRPLFETVEKLCPSYMFYGGFLYSKDSQYLASKDLDSFVQSFFAKAKRRDILKLEYNGIEYRSVSMNYPYFSKENFQEFLIERVFGL